MISALYQNASSTSRILEPSPKGLSSSHFYIKTIKMWVPPFFMHDSLSTIFGVVADFMTRNSLLDPKSWRWRWSLCNVLCRCSPYCLLCCTTITSQWVLCSVKADILMGLNFSIKCYLLTSFKMSIWENIIQWYQLLDSSWFETPLFWL